MVYRITSLLLQAATDLREKHPRENTAAAPAVEQEMGKAQKSPAALSTSFPNPSTDLSWDEPSPAGEAPLPLPPWASLRPGRAQWQQHKSPGNLGQHFQLKRHHQLLRDTPHTAASWRGRGDGRKRRQQHQRGSSPRIWTSKAQMFVAQQCSPWHSSCQAGKRRLLMLCQGNDSTWSFLEHPSGSGHCANVDAQSPGCHLQGCCSWRKGGRKQGSV